MQVNPLVPGAQDRHFTLTIHFHYGRSLGDLLAAPRKRTGYLVCVDSLELEVDDWGV